MRSFFVFDVTGIGNPVSVAALRLGLVDYHAQTIPQTFKIWDVSATAEQLAGDTSGPTGVAVYDDLGGGVFYGVFAPLMSEVGAVLDIRLNQGAVDAINAARNGSGKFIIGLASTSGRLIFSEADEVRTHQLVVVE